MTPKAETLRGGPEIVDILAEEWRLLCDVSGSPLPFSRPEYVAAYFRNNKKAKFLIISVRMNGKLKAVLPLIERTKRLSYLPATVLRGPSDFDLWPFDILMDSGSESLTVEKTLWDSVRNLTGWDILELPNIAEGSAAENLLQIAAAEGYPTHRWEYMRSPYISFSDYPGVKDPLEIARSLNLKKNVKKILRKLENEGGIKVHHLDKADPILLQSLYDLEASSWKGEKGSAILLRQADRTFWDEITQWGQQIGILSLVALEIKNEIAAVGVGLSYNNRYYGLKMGWDNRYKSYSLGHILLYNVLEYCLEHGLSELHLMGLRSPWKERWTNTTRPYSDCYIFRKGLYGRALRVAKLRAISWQIGAWSSKEGYLENVEQYKR
jgi:CelD/BcsL family acetyltransferase involved in cellulose biosynthesis